jgi:type IV fimbrial biogenesis protein FimT
LLAAAAPNFTNWLQSSQIRTSAESYLNAMQLARAEAVRRNVPMRFQLTTSITGNACVLTNAGRNWVISVNDVTGQCTNAPSDTQPDPAPVPLDPLILQKRARQEGSTNVIVAATANPIIFSPLGQANTAATIDFTNPTGGTCAPAGPMRCLRVVVSTGGQAHMCDPARVSTAAAPDPQAC